MSFWEMQCNGTLSISKGTTAASLNWGRIEVWRGTFLVLTHKIALGTTPQDFIANLNDVRTLVRDHVDVGGWLLNHTDMEDFPAGNYTVIIFDENGVEVSRRNMRLN